MAYAGVSDMVDRFGKPEVVRLSDPEDRATETIFEPKVETALADASALIDTYLRRRYATPVAAPPKAIVRAACVLARYDLAKGERTEPTEQMRLDRKEVIAWLEDIAAGRIDIDAPPASPNSGDGGVRFTDRRDIFNDRTLGGW